tara:strand:- start:1494 stop:1733 length:240 start_codon:yes stop_codon:yes gene_type:complete
MNKERVLQIIEEHRIDSGISVNRATKAGLISQSEWDRFKRGERTPTWDKLILMAESVGLIIEMSIDINPAWEGLDEKTD